MKGQWTRFSIYFTITGARKIIRSTKDFVKINQGSTVLGSTVLGALN